MANEYGNYATLNPLYPNTNVTLTNGNLTATYAGSNHFHFPSNMLIPTTGKWAMKATDINTAGRPADNMIGVIEASPAALTDGHDNATSVFWTDRGTVYRAGSNLGNVADAYGINSVLELLYDRDAATLKLYKDGELSYTVTSVPTTANVFSAVANEGGVAVWTLDFGQNGYTATDTDYLNLSTANLPEPAIIDPSAYFQVLKYTGTGSAHTETFDGSSNLQPNLLWIKNRDQNDEWKIIDSVRGATYELNFNSNNAESTDSNGVTGFTSNGFTLGSGAGGYNDNTEKFLAYGFKESATAGFDIVEYSGNNSANRNISHSLGVAPECVLVKGTASGHWWWWHVGFNDATKFLPLDAFAAATATNSPWGTGNFSSSHFMVTNNGTENANASGTNNYIAYLWAGIDGFSSFGTFKGNGTHGDGFGQDGPFVNLGFAPDFVHIINFEIAENGSSFNTTSNPSNPVITKNDIGGVDPDGGSGAYLDLLSNGFKIRYADQSLNDSRYNYIYMAWGRSMTDGGVNQVRAK